MELTEYIAKNHNYYNVNNNTVNDKNSIKNDYFTINGSRRVIDQQDKKYYSSELRHNDLNLNKKNKRKKKITNCKTFTSLLSNDERFYGQ